jgi:hypothetical protein
VWISFAGFILSLGISVHAELPDRYLTAAFCALSIFFIYCLPGKINFRKRGFYFYLSLICALALGIFCFYIIHTLAAFLLLLGVFFISFFYVTSFSFLKIPVRSLPYAKGALIALCWTAACVAFPFVNSGQSIDFLFCVSHFCFFLALTIPFDIRDISVDQGVITTIAVKLGIFYSKLTAVLLLLFFFCWRIWFKPEFLLNPLFLFTIVYLLFLLLLVRKNSAGILFDILLDGSIVLLGLSYFIW